VTTKIVLGVSGGIAAYKSVTLLRLLKKSHFEVTVVPTESALNFVGKPTWEAISGKEVHSKVFQATNQVLHVKLGQEADLIVVAPATADLLYRAAAGAGNDLLTATLLSSKAPVIFFPAMHTEMWEHAATQENIAILRNRGHSVIDPVSGELTGSDEGIGRMPEPEQIHALIKTFLAKPGVKQDLKGKRVLVTLGGTSESIDPIRVITNKSSGEMGSAIVRAAQLRGATVSAIVGNTNTVLPTAERLISVTDTNSMSEALATEAKMADLIIMAAAISDFRPRQNLEKLERSNTQSIELDATEDLLLNLTNNRRPGQTIVGFAAVTSDLLLNAQQKLAKKGCDLIVGNLINGQQGFGDLQTEIILVSKSAVIESGVVTKNQAAHLILDNC
jgi:phosphopantothenoylcysteine decarboxylase/phosphopantothenate--cysteine ligase